LCGCRILDKAENDKGFMAGSTATTAFLLDKGNRLIVANVGDSRAVLARNGTAIEVSVDHEPQKPEEREMVSILILKLHRRELKLRRLLIYPSQI
jgi:serine/threonine protein phosphatase PrpC